ncbi:hypothetical protein JYG23_13955 [Sedimentibacter sp. zth1]|uniref:Ig-like domain-containing alpha-2-macroglobulin family protein n=1 Tax=Sedimentibacter sp. zth1 TaxID=2816908 RepID=UPI001A91A11B|nr:alpha-2-macroglobulin family protein [Sedimentibacter sp. zth1]QSX05749.1 hypothetical protein JYG23_13955 [Sedimentibacter sp. zth1]
MLKRIIALLLCVAFLLTACSNKTDTTINNTDSTDDLPQGEVVLATKDNKTLLDNFKLTATKASAEGIESTSGFTLTSKSEIQKDTIKSNLKIIPQTDFNIEEVSSTVYNIVPTANLKNNSVYQIKFNEDEEIYSWAFQTKKNLQITETIPCDGSNYVPAQTGIEMYFTLNEIENIEEYFEIEPHVEGRFEQKNGMVVFAPSEKLVNSCKYTVTIKKDLSAKNSDETLKDDYTFSFQIEDEEAYSICIEPFRNIYEGNVKFIEGYLDREYENEECIVNIYKYDSYDSFEKCVINYINLNKLEDDCTEDENLTLTSSVAQKPYMVETYYRKKAVYELPKDLAKGYYLTEIVYKDNIKRYVFLQINDLLIYNANTQSETFVFVADGKTNKGIGDVSVCKNNEFIGKTKDEGVLIKKIEDKKIVDEKINDTFYMTFKKEGYNNFIFAKNCIDNTYYDYRYRQRTNNSTDYFIYLDTDRPVYLPTDTINVWGFLRYRDDRLTKNVRIDLVENETKIILDSKKAEISEIGSYETYFDINNITSYGCCIKVYDNDILVDSRGVSIAKYTKPLFKLSGKLDKEYLYSGDDLSYKLNANFYDDAPYPNLKVDYRTCLLKNGSNIQYTEKSNVLALDENGEYTTKVNTDVKANTWRPQTIYVYCFNNEAEDKQVKCYNTSKVFPKKVMLEVEQNNKKEPKKFDILLHKLDLANYNADENDYTSLRSDPMSGKVKLNIVERYCETKKIGEEYDYINKVNVIKYKSYEIENTVIDEYVDISNGLYNFEIPNFNSEREYKITAYYEDGIGGIYEEFWIGRYFNYANDDKIYQIEHKKSCDSSYKFSYRVNEEVNLQLTYNGIPVENSNNDNLVLLMLRENIVDYNIGEDTSVELNFEEKYIPNVQLEGIYIKDGFMYPIRYSSGVDYDETERKISFDVSTDKDNYKPGDEVTLNIKAYDENYKPCKADVNISIVDEAYFAVFGKSTDTLGELYATYYGTSILNSYMSNIYSIPEEMCPEMGGGGGYDDVLRDDFRDTNVFDTITTNDDGSLTYKFKLADNLTSWRITHQAISDKMYAGSGTKNITVSLPFYVNLIMGDEYLKEDKICATLRTFGTEATEGEKVQYTVKIKNKATLEEKEYKVTGIIGEYTNIYLDKLDLGEYEIYAYGSYSDFKDGVKKDFRVADSLIYFNNTDYYKLTDDTVLDEVCSNAVITLFNESKSDFYNSLKNISYGYGGRRIDQTVTSMIANKYMNEYFDANQSYNEKDLLDELAKYESKNGGYKLLPYSKENTELTAKLINLYSNNYMDAKVKRYFYNIIDSAENYNTDVAAALWGLSNYKEPVLLTVYNLLENEELEVRDKLYLSLALTEFGDYGTAYKYYKEILDKNVITKANYLYLDNSINDVDSYELTSLMSVLGLELGDINNSDNLFKYIYNVPSEYTLSNLEQLMYITNRDIMSLEEIKNLFGEITVTVDGKSKDYKLKFFNTESFSIQKEKIKDIRFTNIKGEIACNVDALGNKDDLDKNKTIRFSLDVSYGLEKGGLGQTEFKQSDLLKVIITPTIKPSVESLYYEITYIIPAGFRFMETDNKNESYVKQNGQKITGMCSYNNKDGVKPMIIYMQAVQPGEYAIDYVVMKDLFSSDLNYIEKSKLIIK